MHQSPVGYAVGAIFVAPIMTMVLGFSNKYTYDSSVEVSPNGPIGDKREAATNTEPEKYCLNCGCKVNSNTKFCQNCGKEVQ